MPSPPHLMTLADLSVSQINRTLSHAAHLKRACIPLLSPHRGASGSSPSLPPSLSLQHKSIALLFSKRSTRTRLSAETATKLLGGQALFLGKEDIQLGVNETARDSAKVIGRMCQGIFARVGEHEEIEELARHSPVPVMNALSSLWHPTQILADLLTLHEHAGRFPSRPTSAPNDGISGTSPLPNLTIAWVGDSSNVLHDMLVTYPRLGHKLRVAAPKGAAYQCPPEVWKRVKELGCDKGIDWSDDPKRAVHGADVVVTDTWISMGQEDQKAQRLRDFAGFQVTEKLCQEGGAKKDWSFLHCLPRKQHEVDDEVFDGPRSLIWDEAENRKWTIMALFDQLFGQWKL
ncbi:ornithine carbamoyltransferase [Tulasnella sp. JGI-2019a]|nr:ornithine carbamoyltransferase [Tulasnella sp. JGI-2019a]